MTTHQSNEGHQSDGGPVREPDQPTSTSITELVTAMLDPTNENRQADSGELRARIESNPNQIPEYVAAIELHVLLQTAHVPVNALAIPEVDPDTRLPGPQRPGPQLSGPQRTDCQDDICGAEIAELWGLFDEAAEEFDRSQHGPRSIAAVASSPWGRTAALAGIAAALCAAFFLRGSNRTPNTDPDSSIGVLTNATDARWAGSSFYRLPMKVRPGERLALETGVAELTLKSGVVVVMRGPAEIDVLSAMRVRARSGAVRARVCESAKGFVIETPTTDVIDLGTEFGVDIDPSSGSTDVVVFEGQVDLQYVSSRRDPGASVRSTAPAFEGLGLLHAGEGLRVDLSGSTSRIVAIHSENYPAMVDAGWSTPREPLIREVSDNLRSPWATQYYQIVHRGFREDSRAFVDRLHEWNGFEASGLPSYLLDGDYIQTFNSDKLEPDLRITIDLSAPAMLYILLDDRVDPPGWLVEMFRPTGDSVGVDETFPGVASGKGLDIGPGESIDTRHLVWVRRCDSPGPVELRGLLDEKVRTSMYGVVATPIETSLKSDLASSEAPGSAATDSSNHTANGALVGSGNAP